MKIAQITRPHPTRRTSREDAWPIRRADGKTPAQVRATYKRKETI